MINQIEPNLGEFGRHSGYSYNAACLSSLCNKGGLSQGDIETDFPCLVQTGKDEILVTSCSSLTSMLSPHWTGGIRAATQMMGAVDSHDHARFSLTRLVFNEPPILTKFLSIRKIWWVSTQLFSSYSLGVAARESLKLPKFTGEGCLTAPCHGTQPQDQI